MNASFILKTAIAIAIMFGGASAQADTGYDSCMKTAMTSLAMSDCAGDWNRRAEKRLADNWRAAMDSLSGKTTISGKKLLKEQRAWIKFKDLSCDFYWDDGFGSLHRSVIGPACRNEIIEARAVQLAKISQPLCEGGC